MPLICRLLWALDLDLFRVSGSAYSTCKLLSKWGPLPRSRIEESLYLRELLGITSCIWTKIGLKWQTQGGMSCTTCSPCDITIQTFPLNSTKQRVNRNVIIQNVSVRRRSTAPHWARCLIDHAHHEKPQTDNLLFPAFQGWWFDACGPSNLNGIFFQHGQNSNRFNGIKWYYWKGSGYSLKSTTMMIRPVDFWGCPRDMPLTDGHRKKGEHCHSGKLQTRQTKKDWTAPS